MAHQVTTSVSIHCEFADQDGKPLLPRDIKGKVWFLGGNLRATYDFAKKAAGVAHENFSPAGTGSLRPTSHKRQV
jgi:hypothetical protein